MDATPLFALVSRMALARRQTAVRTVAAKVQGVTEADLSRKARALWTVLSLILLKRTHCDCPLTATCEQVHEIKIDIIGIWKIDGTIARKLKAAKREIRVANSRGLESIRYFADRLGVTAPDVNGAVAGVDVVFLSIRLPAIAELPNSLLRGRRARSDRYRKRGNGPGIPLAHFAAAIHLSE